MKKSLALITMLGLLFFLKGFFETKTGERTLENCGNDKQVVIEEENVEGIFLFKVWFPEAL